MLKDEKQWVIDTINAKVAEAISNIKFPASITTKPVEVDIDGIVKQVLDKISIISTPVSASEAAIETIPKKGKEK